jgi:glycosyltransferase involved in cell wall biosynthesis
LGNKAKLAVGIPVFNGEKFLPELLACLERQSFTDFDVILADNASTDRTADICRDFAQRNPRTTFVRNASNIGATANFNRVFELSNSEHFCWLAYDDAVLPTYFERCVGALDGDPSIALCFAQVEAIDDHGNPLPVSADGGGLVYSNNNFRVFRQKSHLAEGHDPISRYKEVLKADVGGSGNHIYGVMRSDVLRKTRLHQRFPGSELALLLEVALRGRFKTLDERLFLRRYHSGCSSFFRPEDLERYMCAEDVPPTAHRFIRARAYASAILRTETLSLLQRTRGLAVVMAHTVCGLAKLGLRTLQPAFSGSWQKLAPRH